MDSWSDGKGGGHAGHDTWNHRDRFFSNFPIVSDHLKNVSGWEETAEELLSTELGHMRANVTKRKMLECDNGNEAKQAQEASWAHLERAQDPEDKRKLKIMGEERQG